MPKVCHDLLFPEHVRFIPEACDGIADALGVIIPDYCSLGELKALCPETVGKMGNDDLRGLLSGSRRASRISYRGV
jgi:hypothetical protein